MNEITTLLDNNANIRYIKTTWSNEPPRGTVTQVMFTNGHGISIAQNEMTYGNESGLFEIAVLDENGDLDYSTPITNDVIGWLTWEDVIAYFDKVAAL